MSKPRVEPRTYSRAKRREQIMMVFRIAAQHEDFTPKSVADVGRLIGLNRSPHLRDILHEMAEAGDLVESWRDEPGKLGAFVFCASDRTLSRVITRRHIAVRSRGQVVGQMEVFS